MQSIRQFRSTGGRCGDFLKIFKYSLAAKARKIRLDMPLGAVHLKDVGLERGSALMWECFREQIPEGLGRRMPSPARGDRSSARSAPY